MQERKKYIDLAKTMAIFFVVFGHTIELTKINETLMGRLDLIAYTLHVPAFLFASGFLLQKSVKKYNVRQFFLMKFFNLFVVWVIWSVILTIWNMGIDYIFGQYTGNIKAYINYSANEIWYFAFLFVGSMFVFVIENIKINKYLCTISLCVAFIILSFYSVTLAKVVLHLLIIWCGYNFKGFTKLSARLVIIVYIIMMLYINISGCLTLKSIGDLGFGTMGLLGIKLLSCFCLPTVAYLMMEADNKMIKSKEQIYTNIGKNTLYIYILHFFPLAVYKCIKNTSLILALISVLFFIVISMFVRHFIKDTKIDKFLFTPYQNKH